MGRYSPELSEAEEGPDPQRPARHARPDQRGSPVSGPDRPANGAGPRVLLRWSGRPESLGSPPPVQAMLRSHPQDARPAIFANVGEGGSGGTGSRMPRPRSHAAGLSPDHSLRRSQRSMRSAASPSPAPEPSSRHPADANGSAAAFTQMPSQTPLSASATGPAGTNGFTTSPGRRIRTRLRHFNAPSASLDEHSDALLDEQEQLEEAIRQSLLSTEEKQQAEGNHSIAAPSSTAQRSRSGLRIKLRGT